MAYVPTTKIEAVALAIQELNFVQTMAVSDGLQGEIADLIEEAAPAQIDIAQAITRWAEGIALQYEKRREAAP